MDPSSETEKSFNPTTASSDPEKSSEPSSEIILPKSWKYKSVKLGPLQLPWYASPPFQLVIISFVCFMCPGMFNALTGLGGGGLLSPVVADNANVALYSTFSVVGFFAGTFTNRLGIKVALSFGGIGYTIYVSSLLCYKLTANSGFAYFAGALLGVCAGLLWSAQGSIMMSYPPENSKGRYISWFWMIFNFGAVIGALIPLGENIHRTEAQTASTGTYVGFIVLTFIGALLSFTLVDNKDVIRKDGSRVILMKHPSWSTELLGLWETFTLDPMIVLLFPMFFASNWFYTYQFNEFNSAKFNIRTTSVNNVLYWLSQIIGAFSFGFFLDSPRLSRRTRALAGWTALFAITMGIWGGGYAWQRLYSRKHMGKMYDFKTNGYVGPLFLYMFYGFYDAAWQTSVYWLMGAMTNNGRRLANYAGFYKGIQSAGAAIAFRIDALHVPYMNYFASCWALLGGSLLIAFPMIYLRVQNHVTIEEDLKFSDESYEEVAPTHDRHEI